MPCAGQIHLCGPCPDVPTVLAAADGFVVDPFFEAGFPLALMEALCAGVPVVISDVAGAHEKMGESGCRGFVVNNPLGDPDAMDWRSMGRAQFRSQSNRTVLAEAMSAVIADRDRWRDARSLASGRNYAVFGRTLPAAICRSINLGCCWRTASFSVHRPVKIGPKPSENPDIAARSGGEWY
jgi:glycosyltransferase involved in cell wall biosynthesis